MGLSDISTAPQANILTNWKERKAAGIGDAYSDDYNSLQMAKYNNEFNYWAWQQQADYNSPANQVERLKAAGLNPNFNSIEGAGNVGSLAGSSARATGTIGANQARNFQNGLAMFNSVVDTAAEALNSVDKISHLPVDIGQARQFVSRTLQATASGSEMKAMQSMVDAYFDAYMKGMDKPFGTPLVTVPTSLGVEGVPIDPSSSPQKQIIDTLNSLRSSNKDLNDIRIDVQKSIQKATESNASMTEAKNYLGNFLSGQESFDLRKLLTSAFLFISDRFSYGQTTNPKGGQSTTFNF